MSTYSSLQQSCFIPIKTESSWCLPTLAVQEREEAIKRYMGYKKTHTITPGNVLYWFCTSSISQSFLYTMQIYTIASHLQDAVVLIHQNWPIMHRCPAMERKEIQVRQGKWTCSITIASYHRTAVWWCKALFWHCCPKDEPKKCVHKYTHTEQGHIFYFCLLFTMTLSVVILREATPSFHSARSLRVRLSGQGFEQLLLTRK